MISCVERWSSRLSATHTPTGAPPCGWCSTNPTHACNLGNKIYQLAAHQPQAYARVSFCFGYIWEWHAQVSGFSCCLLCFAGLTAQRFQVLTCGCSLASSRRWWDSAAAASQRWCPYCSACTTQQVRQSWHCCTLQETAFCVTKALHLLTSSAARVQVMTRTNRAQAADSCRWCCGLLSWPFCRWSGAG